MPQIVAICLVRNEEFYLDRALANIVDFCDRILIADNGSRDRTPEIAKAWTARHEKVICRPVRHPRESHRMIEPYVGTDTWIFGVDGDEIYDPGGLRRMRARVLDGEFSRYWQVFGNVLNCTNLVLRTNTAEGHLAPPCRSITKLFNFGAIARWDGASVERLHGGNLEFRSGYSSAMRLNLNESVTWEDACFRCLHLCFLPRSSLDRVRQGHATRWNLAEQHGGGVLRFALSRLLNAFNRTGSSSWKTERYARGERVTKDVSCFFA
jgi:glycosyltransferase involved in cell wall biosynthesis